MDHRTSGTATRAARTLDRALTVIDPRSAAAQLRAEPAWHNDDRASVTLTHGDPMRIVLTSLHRDAVIGADTSNDWACIDVVEGGIDVEHGGQRVQVQPGGRVVLSPGAWSLTALEDPTLILSTFTPPVRDAASGIGG